MLTSFLDTSVRLDQFGLQRHFPVAKGYREEDYKDSFDTTTLFYDVFRSFDKKHIVFLGPKPFGFEEQLSKATFYLSGKKLRAKQKKLKQIHEIWIKVPAQQAISAIDVVINGISVQVEVSPQVADRFEGKRVLATLCKETPTPWIIDWIKFHRINHGVNAVVLYENSDCSSWAEDAHKAIEQENPDMDFEVVHVPFKYGPERYKKIKFLQRSILQHMRWKYTQTCEGLLNCDIDELIVCENGKSVFDGLQECPLGYFLIAGVWVEPAVQEKDMKLTSLEERKHSMFRHTTTPPEPTHRKWVAAPSRIPMNLQFKVHAIRPEPKYVAWLHPFYTRLKPYLKTAQMFHLHAINNSWKTDRQKTERVDSHKHILQKHLSAAFDAAFPETKTPQG